uniref:Uncharacterized protein n=1 Tax=Physcomitrium patens TaxID=3218 RepID=A0A2K1ISD6_PHYPA|nr:hypothetical protein PHYPA_026322 [Physcomitrium patens]
MLVKNTRSRNFRNLKNIPEILAPPPLPPATSTSPAPVPTIARTRKNHTKNLHETHEKSSMKTRRCGSDQEDFKVKYLRAMASRFRSLKRT